jgi:hypothetical protein
VIELLVTREKNCLLESIDGDLAAEIELLVAAGVDIPLFVHVLYLFLQILD